ncbi:MAG: transposase [Patescibacteria group bacterium]|nr:transposase [Patescibacteria group bacterium]
MPREPRNFANNEIYHIIQRGIEDKPIFLDKNDYYRGIFSLYEFNNTNPVEIRQRRAERKRLKIYRGSSPASLAQIEEIERTRRNLFVEIFCFCLMPNHIHLILKQIKDDGISEFMRKMGGYVTYFNQKYQRKGHLFQNQFKAIHIADDEQLKTEFVYVHSNPISLIEPGWKEKGIKNLEEAINFIEKYKWSSYADYLGGKNFPSLTNRCFLSEIMGGVEGCHNFINSWLEYKAEIYKTQNL